MSTKDIISSVKSKKGYARWSKSQEVNGVTNSITVKEVENGFIIEINKYGRDTTKKDSNYYDESKSYISKTNPLDGQEADNMEQDEFSLGNIGSVIKDIFG